jgi:hypothetical protein
MKPYKGIIRIVCERKKGCLKNLKKNVQPGCLDCPKGTTEILDLDEKVLFEYRSPVQRTGKRKKKGTKAEGAE